MSRLPTAVIAAVTLVVGFAVAQGTGVRWLGGVVLAAGLLWCAVRSAPAAGLVRTAAAGLVVLAAFVASHLAADALGPWPSVLLAALLAGAGVWFLVDRAVARRAVRATTHA
ncbi:hypothetical protein [Cellulomonas cellasea]|uniref:Uncharacterized protein n=2 Tax=Cellulomonas cellasea TaxID=43670 RepID=A0A0A0B5R6_9CELL|nr:hypothetical protein [Cellulomonas cellasea]KGM00626.1 hypothetical protein Q760_07300 [Cellulomonas cellasea DSM 20118]